MATTQNTIAIYKRLVEPAAHGVVTNNLYISNIFTTQSTDGLIDCHMYLKFKVLSNILIE